MCKLPTIDLTFLDEGTPRPFQTTADRTPGGRASPGGGPPPTLLPDSALTADRGEMLRLMEEADALVESLGVDGSHSAIQHTVALVASAYALQNIDALRTAVAEFMVQVRRLASDRIRAMKADHP